MVSGVNHQSGHQYQQAVSAGSNDEMIRHERKPMTAATEENLSINGEEISATVSEKRRHHHGENSGENRNGEKTKLVKREHGGETSEIMKS